MAHTKTGGKTRQHTNRRGKRLGVKMFGGETTKTGMIIVRQRGTKFHPGTGVGLGRDHTIFALKTGTVTFKQRLGNQTVSVI